jgi:acyl transferase domain-containing protein/acyl carrier protein
MDPTASPGDSRRKRQTAVAVVGLGLRFPQAPDASAFWSGLCRGFNAITPMPTARQWPAAWFDAAGTRGRIVTAQGGFVEHLDQFDWKLFRILPREAEQMDPQHRLLLEIIWEAFEDAGWTLPLPSNRRTGVFIGMSWNDYFRRLAPHLAELDGYTASGNCFAFASNRISYTFDLQGPSLTVDAGCVSSLASVHLACQSLRHYESDLAIAGGVELILSPDSSVIMSQAGMLSPTGSCRPLDAAADGFVRGEGAGVVLLKRVSDLTAADRVYAVITGTALNHKGNQEWLMAPSSEAQASVLSEALASAGRSAADLDYVELNGTGFAAGDRIECEALGRVLGSARPTKCRVGSLKANIGNLGAAAGMASLIKVALSLSHRALPPTLLEVENPLISFESLGMDPQREFSAWPAVNGKPPVAAVHGTSLGGANAHVIVEGAPEPVRGRRETGPEPAGPWLLLFSAATDSALHGIVNKYHEVFSRPDADSGWFCHDVMYTLAVRRTHLARRWAVIGRSRSDFQQQFQQFLERSPRAAADSGGTQEAHGGSAPVPASARECVATADLVWGRQWYRQSPAFRQACDHVTTQLKPLGVDAALDGFLGGDAVSGTDPAEARGAYLNFAFRLALVELGKTLGMDPSATFGETDWHLLGEYAEQRLSLESAWDQWQRLAPVRETATVATQFLRHAGASYQRGQRLKWELFFDESVQFLSLPSYAWDRVRCWPAWLKAVPEPNGQPAAPLGPVASPPEVISAAASGQGPEFDLGIGHESLPAPNGASERRRALTEWLQRRLQVHLGLPAPAMVRGTRSFRELGLDSVMAITLRDELAAWLKRPLNPTLLFEYSTVASLVEFLVGPDEARESRPLHSPPLTAEALPAPAGPELTELSLEQLEKMIEEQTAAVQALTGKL